MTMLVTLDQAKAHLRVTHSSDDADIELKVEAASGAVLNYLKSAADAFLDSSGEPIMTTDSPPVSTVPREVQQATLLMLGWMFNFREGEGQGMTPGYLPVAVVSLLYPLRDPALA